MNVQRWETVKELLHRAMQLQPEQRGLFLDEACSSDAEVRAEVESLLLAEEGIRPSFMQPRSSNEPGADGADNTGTGSAGVLQPGQVFADRFQIVRELGEGGMGQVWLADQISPVRRQVALKLIKAGMYDKSVVQRFQTERQSLAIMDHPAIAKVFDAGATPQGQPYFVMEYVSGLPITEYCDRKKLKIGDRLELFIQACEGVQHAHQKAIIHRDLKPANILVVEVDGKPVPRIIDFGLAKATTPQVGDETLFTQFGHFVGTPGYMSPEQADPSVLDIDTRTDVYSLGVVLYVLLTGWQPLDTRQGKNQPLDEVLRKLREEEPPFPSTKISADREAAAAGAAARGTEPRYLVRMLRGDLDWITMKALEKDRSRRYGAPSELAADLRRFLNREPVMARPASIGYRLRKSVQRHRVAVIAVAGLAVLLATFFVVQASELRRITRERDRANRERDRATRITDFMAGMFKVSDPNQARSNSITAREILDKASKDMNRGLARDPEIQSQLMLVMSRTYAGLGLYPRAHELAQSALDTRLRLMGPDDPKTLESMTQMGWILEKEGHYNEAAKLDRDALASDRRILGAEDPLTLEAMGNLAVVAQGQGNFGEGEKLAREAIEVGTRTLGPESTPVRQSMKYLGNALWYQGRLAEAEREYRQLLDLDRRVLGPDHPETLTAMNNLALVLEWQDRFAEAEQLGREAMATGQRVLGPEHPVTANFTYNYAGLLFTEHRLADAEKLYREVLAIQLRTLGPEHPDTLNSKSELADDLFAEGHVREAEQLQRETLATRLRILGPENPRTLVSQEGLAETLIKEGHYAEAEKLARQTFDVAIRTLGPLHSNTLSALQQLVAALAYAGHSAEATQLFHDVMEKGQNSDSGDKGDPKWWYAFARMAAVTHHPDDALQYLQESVDCGYKDADALTADDDLKNLRPNPKFQQLVAALKQKPPILKTQK
jgi:serine/threonine protein kinase